MSAPETPLQDPLQSERLVHIYALRDPETGRIHYVGQSINPGHRLKAHYQNDGTSERKRGWLKSLGCEPEVVTLEVVPSEQANAAELSWIKRLLDEGEPLTNCIGARARLGIAYPHLSLIAACFGISPEDRLQEGKSVCAQLVQLWYDQGLDFEAIYNRSAISEKDYQTIVRNAGAEMVTVAAPSHLRKRQTNDRH